MIQKHFDILIEQKPCDTFAVYPEDSGHYPGVILLMDAFGPRAYLEQMATTLAEHGYYVLVPNMFFRIKRAPIVEARFPLKPEDMPEVRKSMMAVYGSFSPDQGVKDIGVMLEFLSVQTQVRAGKVGLTGYCMGGGLALRTAGTYANKVAAVASFHAGNLANDAPNSPHLFIKKIESEIYIAHADNDASMPPEQREKLQQAIETSGVTAEVEVYKGAAHGFTMADLPAYNEAALDRHWEKLLALFQRRLKA
jgi:carboxymethylenebutenolidase